MKKTYQTPGILVKEVKIQQPLAESPTAKVINSNDDIFQESEQLSKQSFVSFIGGWDAEE